MQPATETLPLEKVWYRGDEVGAINDERAKYRCALEAIHRLFTEAPDPEIIDILDIVEGALK